MNYISLLNEEEIRNLCNIISGKDLKNFFKNMPKEFAKIKPGFRPNKLSDNEAVSLAIKNINKEFISKYVNLKVDCWLKEIEEYNFNLCSSGKEEEEALVETLYGSVFSENIEIYFKFKGKEVDDAYLRKLKELVSAQQGIKEKIFLAGIDESEELDASKLRELLKEKEQQIGEYKSRIEALKEKNVSLEQIVEEEQKKTKAIQMEKQDVETELADFRAREKFDDTEKDIEAVNNLDYDYISICEVERDYNGQVWLNRLADIGKSGILQAFYLNEDMPKYFSNRSRLFFKDGPSRLGTIGGWNWSTIPNNNDPSKDYVITQFNPDIRPIEIIKMQDCKSSKEVLEILKNGVEVELTADRTLFAAYLSKGQYSGFLCTNSDFEHNGNKIKLGKNVIAIPRYDFVSKDIAKLSNGRIYFKSVVIGMPSEVINVKDPMDVVRTAILARNSWNVFKQQGKTRSEWRKFKDFLENLDARQIIEDISEAADCYNGEAQKMFDDFMDNVGDYVDATTVEDGIIAAAIAANSELMDRCKVLVKEDWITENKSAVDAANAELEELRKKVEQTQAQYDKECAYAEAQIKNKKDAADKELKEVKLEHDRLSATLQRLNDDISNKEQFALEVEQSVEERIRQAQSNAAEFVAGLAFVPKFELRFTNSKTIPDVPEVKESEDLAKYYYPGIKLGPDQIEENGSWIDTLDEIAFELVEAGVSERYSRSFAAYMYAAYLNKSCLLMIGPNGSAIVDAFSRAVFGRRAGCLRCTERYNATSLEECLHSEDVVVNVVDPFSSGWVTYIPRLMNSSLVNAGHKYFIATYPYAEDIHIEPKSIYNYMLPVFTELFIEKLPNEIESGIVIGGVCADNFEKYNPGKVSNIHNKLLTEMHTSLLIRIRIQSILSNMHEMLQDKNLDYDFIFALLPYAYATMQTSLILDAIKDIDNKKFSVSKDIHELIEELFGENE